MFPNGTGRLRPRHLKILIRPLCATGVALLIWHILRSLGWCQTTADASHTTNSLLPLQCTFHAIVAGFLLIRVMEEDVRIHTCVEEDNVEQLRKELKKRIHPLVHILLGVLSILIVADTVFLPFENVWSGVQHVGGTTLILSLYWATAIALDNPFSTPWVRDVIPEEMRRKLEEADAKEVEERRKKFENIP